MARRFPCLRSDSYMTLSARRCCVRLRAVHPGRSSIPRRLRRGRGWESFCPWHSGSGSWQYAAALRYARADDRERNARSDFVALVPLDIRRRPHRRVFGGNFVLYNGRSQRFDLADEEMDATARAVLLQTIEDERRPVSISPAGSASDACAQLVRPLSRGLHRDAEEILLVFTRADLARIGLTRWSRTSKYIPFVPPFPRSFAADDRCSAGHDLDDACLRWSAAPTNRYARSARAPTGSSILARSTLYRASPRMSAIPVKVVVPTLD